MANAEDPLNILFSRINCDSTLQKLPFAMVDEIRILLYHKNGGANIVYCENLKVPPSYPMFTFAARKYVLIFLSMTKNA